MALGQAAGEILVTPVSITNGGTASGVIDTLGYDEIWVTVTQGTSNTASNNLSVCTFSEGTSTNLTEATDITALVGDGAGGFTIPNANTANPQVYLFHIDKRNGPRERYIHLELSPVTTQILGATALKLRGKEAPVNATDAGVALLVEA